MPMSVQKKAQRVFEQMSFDPRHIGMGKPELLSGDLRGTCSIRLTQTDRIYYKIDDERKVVSISSLFGHK
ncbi:type II toxin-antitoxin system YoeB family toxin [Candidatus Saccharibacteria bacterium]|nr:type II toxin-antitoxin system YoeB family toxin [Candidatus Saccharibacteria bacterium]